MIVHCAPYGNMAHHTDEDAILQANIIALHNLLQASKRLPYKAFINISSSSVLLHHETLYSATKKGGEALCKWMADEYGKPIVSLRPSSITGKGEQETHLIPRLIQSCLTGEKMQFVPKATHDFIDVRDVVHAILFLSNKADKYKGRSFNVSNGFTHSNEKVKEIVEKLTGKKANTEKVEALRSYDTKNWEVDNSPLKSIGWKPKFTLEESIQFMLL